VANEIEQRADLPRAAVGFALVPPTEPERQMLHHWFDNWRGVSDVVRGMARRGSAGICSSPSIDAENWRGAFFIASHAHSIVGGTPWETTAWRATAWEALNETPV
jgi:hypothetical protein